LKLPQLMEIRQTTRGFPQLLESSARQTCAADSQFQQARRPKHTTIRKKESDWGSGQANGKAPTTNLTRYTFGRGLQNASGKKDQEVEGQSRNYVFAGWSVWTPVEKQGSRGKSGN
jgi:hypothetical protein